MKSGTSRVALILALASACAVLASHATAQVLTNDMYCEDVIAQFEQTGRVYTRSRHGTVLPIYGGVPARFRSRLRCGPFSVPFAKYVISRDRRQCLISYRCN